MGSINWYYPKRSVDIESYSSSLLTTARAWDAKATLIGIPYIKDAHQGAVRAMVDNLYIPYVLSLKACSIHDLSLI